MIAYKLRNVPDAVCVGCCQLWEGQCRATVMPESPEERAHRLGGRKNRIGKQRYNCDVLQFHDLPLRYAFDGNHPRRRRGVL